MEDYKKTVNDKELAIIELRLFTEEPITLQEIADKFGVSRERIRQIEQRLKGRLKSYLKEKLSLNSQGEILSDWSGQDKLILD